MPEMTIEAAIIELNRLKSQERMDIDRERLNAAIDVLKDAARYRVKRKVSISVNWYVCPQCISVIGQFDMVRTVGFSNFPYCQHCGQALDWSD